MYFGGFYPSKNISMKAFLFKSFLIGLFGLWSLPPCLHADPWQSRHNLSSAQYQQTFDDMKKEGYRIQCVSGYTKNGQELYEGLWTKPGSTPAWESHHGMSASGYQNTFDELKKKGYRLTWINGCGVSGQAKFSAIWEKKSGPAWEARHNLTAAQYQQTFDDLKKKGYRLQQVCGYVVGGQPYFAGIWDKSSGGAWEARHNLKESDYQSTFDGLDSKGYILKNVSGYNVGGTDYYAAVWEKKSSPHWWARNGIPDMNYQHAFDNMYYQGYYPIYLNAFASGNSSRYNVIWNNTAMKWSDINTIDKAAKGYMNGQHVKGLSLAVCKDGRLVFAKSYGYADPSTGEELCPNHSMRVMSVSKPITACGIMKLYEQDNKLLTKHAFGPGSILGSKYTTPSGQKKLNNITVRQLLWHTSGLRTCNGESIFWDKNKTMDDAMNTLLNAGDLMTWDTSVKYNYSNANFFILARIIEVISGQSYENFIRQKLLTPAGIGNTMYVGNADGNSRSGEVAYDPADKMNLQLWSGFGGWVARPMDLLKLLNRVDGVAPPSDLITANTHTVMTTGSSLNSGYGLGWIVGGGLQAHNGCFDGTRSFLVQLSGGISYAVIINNNPDNDGCGWTMKSAIETGLTGVSAWPSYDLF